MGLPAVMMAATGLQGLMSMSAQNQAAEAQAQSYENERAVAEYNKQLTDQDRQANVQNAEIAREDLDRDNRRLYASMKAAYGASGFELAGSPLEVLQDTSIEMALDSRRMDYQTRVLNREGGEKIKSLSQAAKDAERGIKNTMKAAKISRASTFLNTATSIGKSYYNMQNGTGL